MSKDKRNQAPRPTVTGDDPSSDGDVHNGMSLSMHNGVEVWCDCCSCEAEPYWLAAFEKKTAASVNRP